MLTLFLLAAGIYSAIQAWRAVDAANRAAGAASEQAKTADDTEKHQLRAYLGITISGIYCPACIEKESAINIIRLGIKNYGPTPGYAPIVSGDIKRVRYGESLSVNAVSAFIKKNPRPTENEKIRAHQTVWPTETQSYVLNIDHSQDFADARYKKNSIFIYGKVDYWDIFNIQHVSWFCYFFNGDMLPVGVPGTPEGTPLGYTESETMRIFACWDHNTPNDDKPY